MIDEIERLVEAACAAESNIFGYGIWTYHITQVARNGKRLAPMFEADAEVVEIGGGSTKWKIHEGGICA